MEDGGGRGMEGSMEGKHGREAWLGHGEGARREAWRRSMVGACMGVPGRQGIRETGCEKWDERNTMREMG